MAIKTFKPTTPSRRHMTVSAFEGIDKKAKPERSLVESQKKHAGRNSYGRITVRHHGGGNKQKYRIIDFKRDKMDVPATVLRLEYDPNRSAFIALVQYEDGEKRYIIAPVGLKAGDKIISSASADIKPGNCLPIANIPVGTAPRQGRSARPLRRYCCSADGEGERRRSDPYALRRSAHRPHELHGRHRPGRQHRSRERSHR